MSVIVVGMAYTSGTMASVLRPELSGLAKRAADSVTNKAQPQGAERFFMDEENALLNHEVSLILARGTLLARKTPSSRAEVAV